MGQAVVEDLLIFQIDVMKNRENFHHYYERLKETPQLSKILILLLLLVRLYHHWRTNQRISIPLEKDLRFGMFGKSATTISV